MVGIKNFSLEEREKILEHLAILVIGLVYKNMPDEVCRTPQWKIINKEGQVMLIVNFDWWFPFNKITARQIKSVILIGLKGLGVEIKGRSGGHYDFSILLKNGQSIIIGRYEAKNRDNCNNSIMLFLKGRE